MTIDTLFHKARNLKKGTAYFLIILSLSCCREDYQMFDEAPTVQIGAPKIRFLNLHFRQPNITTSLGANIVGEAIPFRQLTSYFAATGEFLADSILTVTDPTGAILLQEKLDIRLGSNYTVLIFPAYEREISNYLVESNFKRYMHKALSGQAKISVLKDLTKPPFQDRAAVRWASLAPDEAANAFNNVRYIELRDKVDSGNYSSLLTKEPPPPYAELDYTGFSLPISWRSPEFNSLNPPFFQTTAYQVIPPKKVYLAAGGVSESFVDGFSVGVYTLPKTWEGDKSYTILTSGTFGLVNDLQTPTQEKKPTPLEPIPYEIFLIDESDTTARMLESEPLSEYFDYFTNIFLCEFHEDWHIRNFPKKTNLLIGGQPARWKNNGNWISSNQFIDAGLQRVELTHQNSTRPVLGSADVTLTRGNVYLAYHYKDLQGKTRFEVKEVEKIFKKDVIRLNVCHFSPDLGNVDLIKKETGEVLISDISFSSTSPFIDLQVTYNETDPINPLAAVAGLSIVQHGSSKPLFDVNLSSNGRLVFEGGGKGSSMIYSLQLSGRFYSPEIFPFKKNIIAGLVDELPLTSADRYKYSQFNFVELP